MRTSKLKSFQSILPLVILGVALLASVAIMIDRLRISEPTSQAATPADFLQAQGKDLMYRGQKVVLRGVNFDNIGALGAGIGTNNVNDVKYIEQDYQTLSAQGGNHARFGMAYTWWANDKTKFYQVMDAQVALARKHNIFLTLLTFTNPDGGDGCYEGYSEHCSLWTNTTYQNQLKDFWIDVATHYKDEPAVAGYDLVNEPTPPGPNWCTTWFNYAQTLRNAVAAVAPNQLVFIEACSDPTFDRIFKEPNGTKAKNVVYEVHDYEPMEMSHPGYNGAGNAKTYPGNATVWTNEGVQKSFYFDKSTFAGTRYPGQYSIAEDFSLNWANQNDVPLYIGEWGAQGFLNGHNQYYKDKGEVYRDLGINHAYYTWRHDVLGGWRWGLYNSSGALVAPDQAKLDAARTSWANSVKPSFSTTNTPSPQPSASVVPTATPGVSPTPTPTPTPSPSTTPGPTGTLRVQGMSLAQGSNRFIVEGVNIEFFRDPGCSYITTGQYPKRAQIAQKMKDLGINAVRFNYSLSWLGQSPANMTQFLDMMQAFTQKGIYVMPSDHAYTGKSLSGRSASYPLFKQIIEGARAKGFEQYLIMNPYNEPGPQDSWSVWATANKDTLTYLRNTAGFKGVVVLDTLSWAAAFDSASQLSVRTHDGTLLNGTPNVMFANHWYPNISISSVNATVNASNTVPVVIGELGQINPGSSGLDPGYVSSVFSSVINTGIPKGHNGIFAWMWNWCDENGMTEDDFVTLNTYGNLNVSGYYSKVNGGTAPTPTPSTSPTPGVSPTPTPTPTPTPVPTGSLTITQGVKFTASGSLITATAKYKNNTNQPITTTRFAIASRPPGGTNDGGPYYDFEPYVAGRTLAAGQEVTITATRTFTASDPDGGWYAYPTYELADGSWIDGALSSYLNFNVSANGAVTWNNQASPTPTPVPSPSPSPTPTPSPTPGTKTADFNNDGKVDLRDYGILVVNFFHSGANQPTDLNSDGIVDLRDYTLLVQQFHL